MRKLLLSSGALLTAGVLAYGAARLAHGPRALDAQGAGRLPYASVTPSFVVDGVPGELPAGLSGLGAEIEVILFREGAGETRKLPGRVKWGDITLKKGYISEARDAGAQLRSWFDDIRGGNKLELKTGSILLKATDGSTHAQYEFYEGWPCKWLHTSVPDAQLGSPDEAIGFVVQKVRRLK